MSGNDNDKDRQYAKMWLIAAVARLETIPEDQRMWVVNRMAIMSRQYGLNMAMTLSRWPVGLVGQRTAEPDGETQRMLFIEGVRNR